MFKDKTILITGAGRGIGRNLAIMMAENGAELMLTDRDEEPIRKLVDDLEAYECKVSFYTGDLTDQKFPDQLVKETISSFGKLDILVNNAGYTWDGMIHKMSDEQFQAMIDIHLFAPFRLIRASAPYMREVAKQEIEKGITNYRKIVNVSSVAGVMGNVGQANYASAKAGVIGLTKTIAREWGQFNINCNAVAFGLIDTRLTKAKEKIEDSDEKISLGIPEKVRTMFEKSIPQRRAGTAEEAAQGIFYLASPLSNYINGQVLHLNGGWYT
ncbi:SDR family oxidoreductase [Bacillus sp. F19]|nr:SDR family oxidoreductase [Bacillus sp. F19]